MDIRYPYLKHQAQAMLTMALYHGDLNRPNHCERCGCIPKSTLHGHHTDYSQPLVVIWICSSCHRIVHATEFDEMTGRRIASLRPSPKAEIVRHWIQEHPSDIDVPCRDLAAILNVSFVTVFNVQKSMRGQSQHDA